MCAQIYEKETYVDGETPMDGDSVCCVYAENRHSLWQGLLAGNVQVYYTEGGIRMIRSDMFDGMYPGRFTLVRRLRTTPYTPDEWCFIL